MRNLFAGCSKLGILAVMFFLLAQVSTAQKAGGNGNIRRGGVRNIALKPQIKPNNPIGPGTGSIRLREALDYDGDTRVDFVVFRPSTATWYVNKSDGSGVIYQTFGLANDDILAPGDFDGDGKGDISVWRDTTGFWYRLNSNGNTFSSFQWGQTGDQPVQRDYDGDGRTDVAVVRRTNGVMIWYIFQSSTNSISAGQFGFATDTPVPGDYDGDGRFDFAVRRAGTTDTSAAYFYAQTAGGLVVIPWGYGSDIVAPGDYDGDGKTDAAVVREGSTPSSPITWYILQSSNFQLKAATFGATGTDLLVQGDYDGDGKTDICVWRDTTGIFYGLRSIDNGFFAFQWGLPSDIPAADYDTH